MIGSISLHYSVLRIADLMTRVLGRLLCAASPNLRDRPTGKVQTANGKCAARRRGSVNDMTGSTLETKAAFDAQRLEHEFEVK